MEWGIIFVATGDTCRNEAQLALMTLGNSNPSLPVTIFTDKPEYFKIPEALSVSFEIIKNPYFSFKDKIFGFQNTPYENTLFLDADTFITGSLIDLEPLFDRFDLATIQDPLCNSKYPVADYEFTAPESFPEMNTGVVLFRKSEEMSRVLQQWQELYDSVPAFRNDQGPFREAVYNSTLSLHVLPKNFNFMPGLAGVIEGPILIFHSPRAREFTSTFIDFINTINHTDQLRLYTPPNKIQYF